jgi:sugar lactone lactonase YvrE
MGRLDEDTLYVTSWAEQALYTVDFTVDGDDLLLSDLTVVNPFIPGTGPDGVAIIPPNAPGELAGYAGNLVIARFGGTYDGYVDIFDPAGRGLARLATYRKNNTPGFIGPDGITFGPDGTLFVSDFDQTIFRISAVPEPATVLLLATGVVVVLARRASRFTPSLQDGGESHPANHAITAKHTLPDSGVRPSLD